MRKHSESKQNLSKSDVAGESLVGIFWLYNGKLITNTTPLSEAEPDGNILGFDTGHIAYWTALQERGAFPIEVEYDEPPRGRVGYNVKKKAFFMLADQCIIDDAETVQKIIAALHLPASTEPMADSDYRCAKCLNRTRR
jgi:hypothetical protein